MGFSTCAERIRVRTTCSPSLWRVYSVGYVHLTMAGPRTECAAMRARQGVEPKQLCCSGHVVWGMRMDQGHTPRLRVRQRVHGAAVEPNDVPCMLCGICAQTEVTPRAERAAACARQAWRQLRWSVGPCVLCGVCARTEVTPRAEGAAARARQAWRRCARWAARARARATAPSR